MNYEYKTLLAPLDTDNIVKTDEALNAQGAEGWELVQFQVVASRPSALNPDKAVPALMCVLKRVKVPTPEEYRASMVGNAIASPVKAGMTESERREKLKNSLCGEGD